MKLPPYDKCSLAAFMSNQVSKDFSKTLSFACAYQISTLIRLNQCLMMRKKQPTLPKKKHPAIFNLLLCCACDNKTVLANFAQYTVDT